MQSRQRPTTSQGRPPLNRPQSAYQRPREAIPSPTAGKLSSNKPTHMSKPNNLGSNLNVFAQKNLRGASQTPSDHSFAPWVRDAMSMVKKGQPNRIKIGTLLNNLNRTDAKQIVLTNENLAEEGKRLEVALRYVSQINSDLKQEMSGCEERLAEFEELLDQNHSLRILALPQGQNVEKMSEALRKEYAKLRRDLGKKLSEREHLQQERMYSQWNEKNVGWKANIDRDQGTQRRSPPPQEMVR